MRGMREHILPPVAAASAYSRESLDARLTHLIDPALRDRPRVLIGMGGIETQLAYDQWPEQEALTLLVANQQHLPTCGFVDRGILNADALCTQADLVFTDLLSCCDVVICKPGYGTFVEAALINIPVLYVEREDWPEQRVLVTWLESNARCARLEPEALLRGDFDKAITALLKQPAKAPIPQDGAMVAAAEILHWLN